MKTLKIALFGGTGFVGHSLCALLASQGHQITLFSRRPERFLDLTVLPTLTLEQIDVYDINQLINLTQGYDVLINLIGILNEPGHKGVGFKKAHVDATRNLLQACQRNKIPRLIQMSALNADADKGSSYYLLSKGMAENAVLHAESNELHVTVLRPSVLFGPGDSFLSKFAKLIKLSPGLMFLPSAQAMFSPLFVGDLVKIIGNCLDNRETWGKAFDLCGPKTYTLQELVEYTAQVTQKRRWIIGLNNHLSKIVAHIFEYLPFKPYSVDNYLSALTPSVCKHPFPVIFNLQPTTLEMVAPAYLGPNHFKDSYYALREKYSKSMK